MVRCHSHKVVSQWDGEDPPRHVAPLQEEIDKYRQGYEIERIVDVRESGAPNELEYLVQWKGFPLLGDTDRWEPEHRLAEGLSPGEAAHLRDGLAQARARKRGRSAARGNPERGANPRRPVFYFTALSLRTRTPGARAL